MKRFRILLSVLWVFVVFNGVCSARSAKRGGADTLALVNGVPITADEFRGRFELTVYPHKDDRSQLQAEKERFLFSMIAERLLADEAIRSGIAVSPESKRLQHEATETYLRDALYRTKILDRIRITRGEISEGLRKADYRYFVDIYYFPDSSSAERFRSECGGSSGGVVDSLVASRRIPFDTMSVSFGELEEKQEDSFWGKPGGFMTRPIEGDGRFAVVRVVRKIFDTSFASLSLQERKEHVRKTIQTRREVAGTKKFVEGIFRGFRVGTRRDLMKMLVDSVSFVLKEKPPSRFELYLNLTEADVGSLLSMFVRMVDVPMISVQIPGGTGHEITLSLGEVIRGLVPAAFYCKDTSKPAVFSGLEYTLRHIVEYRLLAGEADSLGLRNSTEVQRDVASVMTAYFASRMREAVEDTVKLTRSDLDDFMRTYNGSDLRNVSLTVQEFRDLTLDQAAGVFDALARSRDGSAPGEGEILSKVVTDTVRSDAFVLGRVGSFFSQSQPGQIYGPVRNEDGSYAMYRLLTKKTRVPDSLFALAVDTAKMVALSEKRERALNRYVADLAAKGSVKVFIESLKRVHVDPVQMFTVRNIGFGGQINAVPGLAVCEDWTRLAPMREIIIP